jgi:phage terminase large subunit-like protein
MVQARANPGEVEELLVNVATQDDKQVGIGFGRDPGQAGRSHAFHPVRVLSGYTVLPVPESGDKLTRLGPMGGQALVDPSCDRPQPGEPVGVIKRAAVFSSL